MRFFSRDAVSFESMFSLIPQKKSYPPANDDNVEVLNENSMIHDFFPFAALQGCALTLTLSS